MNHSPDHLLEDVINMEAVTYHVDLEGVYSK